jgi:nucleoside-diphosphate-sugar epimerase
MRVLVTGVSGFIGEHLAKHLLEQGHKVRGASRWLDSPFPREEKYEHVTIEDPFSKKAWREITSETDAVVHLIAKTHTQDAGDLSDLSEYRHTNVDITKALFEASWKAGVKRFVYMSSIKAVGEETSPGEAFAEDSPCDPVDSYGISKREAEEMILKYRGKMSTVVLRAPLVYGPGVKGNFLRLMEEVEKGTPLPLAGVKNARSLVFTGNLSAAVVKILEAETLAGGVYHVADDEKPSTPELVEMMAAVMGDHQRTGQLFNHLAFSRKAGHFLKQTRRRVEQARLRPH